MQENTDLLISNSSSSSLFYSFQVHNLESDIDALCVGPCVATIAEDFFIVLHNMLVSRPGVSDIHCVKGAKVPLTRFKFDGISIDLPYARLRVISIPEDVDVFNPFFLKNIDDTSWKSLSGVCANRRILQLVPNVEIFQAVLRCVKLWAKKRGVYGNLPCSPYGFCHSIIVRSTFLKIKTEFRRGHMLTKDMLTPDFDWSILFEPFPYPRIYGKFVKIFLSASDKDELGDWEGRVKSGFGCLIIKLEELLGFCDPNPIEYVDVDALEPTAVFYWGLPPARTEMIDIGHVEEEFLKSTNNVYQGPTGKMKLSVVQADELPQEAHFASE
ncbi:hypothetical protein K7X08_030629 [Anisodus acutangulus]|uniref:polynucleotide adenylyltransferase n=1 Tax=Anisodus acutangulus TaxID=402998 RepID=A0A9Q1L516_9SOLA|nr:hypothetical protein K7X08_030629 [Anisodus acutangulus]